MPIFPPAQAHFLRCSMHTMNNWIKNMYRHPQQPKASRRKAYSLAQHSRLSTQPHPSTDPASQVQEYSHSGTITIPGHFLYFPAPTPVTQAGPPAWDFWSPPLVKSYVLLLCLRFWNPLIWCLQENYSLPHAPWHFAHPFIKGFIPLSSVLIIPLPSLL